MNADLARRIARVYGDVRDALAGLVTVETPAHAEAREDLAQAHVEQGGE